MRTWAKASAPAALLAVAVMSFGGGTAVADTSGNSSVGGGNQVNLPVSLPIDISGNSVGALGSSSAGSQGGASVENHGGEGIRNRTSGDSSVLGGNQVNAPISAPINACGNAVSLFGNADAGCKGGATVKNTGKGGAGGNRTSGDSSVLGGNQVTAPITAPINACGNALAIFGNATAGCKGGASVKNTGKGAGGNTTSGRSSVLGGNQAVAPISAPINICGNAVAVLGNAFAGCKGGSSVENGGHKPRPNYHSAPRHRGSTGNDTDGRFGVGSGNQMIAPVSLPITACGNAVGNAPAGCKGGATVENTAAGSGAGGNRTSGQSGVLAGNQAIAPITAPIDVCGNAIAVLGNAFAGCKGGASVKNGGQGAGGNVTNGRSGVGAGNQVVAPITAPINACGNAVAALGLSEAHCSGGAGANPHGGVGGGGNHTSGQSGVLAGNQVIAPITAPVNVCGNAVAVLGDAAAGCLGGAHVGRPVNHHSAFDHFAQPRKGSVAKSTGVLPALPVPGLSSLQGATGITEHMRSGGGGGGSLPPLPVVGDVSQTLGLPALPGLPGLPGQPSRPAVKPSKPVKPAKPVKPGQGKMRTAAVTPPGSGSPLSALGPLSDLAAGTPVGGALTSTAGSLPVADLAAGTPVGEALTSAPGSLPVADLAAGTPVGGALTSATEALPVADLAAGTPVGGALTSATEALPVGSLGLMSAETPAGVTGMNSTSLFALVLGGMFAASTTLFAATRRFRLGRK
ncbi:chaplin family protein [Nonomuraea longicatena]|uniref:Chaplin domain-containing protein n=1 Tax=Nonomuraea longicatena TaxID=83682 RepID=A0ABN1NWN9_9ACTN